MTKYDPSKLVINKIIMDGGREIRERLKFSAANLTHDSAVGDFNELSINPSTGSAVWREYLHEGYVNVYGEGTPVETGYEIEYVFDNLVIFEGYVSDVSITVSANDNVQIDGYPYVRDYVYSFRSKSGELGEYKYAYGSLPAENPIARLERAIDVDTDLLTSAQLQKVISMTMPAIPENNDASYQYMTYLQMARMFTERTKLPLRTVVGFDVWRRLEIVPNTTVWNDVPLTPVISTNTTQWAHGVTWKSSKSTGPARIPAEVEVAMNNTTFLGGLTDKTISADLLGSNFILGSSRLGTHNVVSVGFRPPAPIDVMGHRLVVSRITQSFGPENYIAQIEVTRPTEIDI